MFENKPKEIPKKEPLPINKGNYVNKLENNFQSSTQRNNNETNKDNEAKDNYIDNVLNINDENEKINKKRNKTKFNTTKTKDIKLFI